MEKVNWGIIGAGGIANTFAKTLVYCENSVPYAIGSRNLEKAEKFANEYGIKKAYGSYEELAKDENIDIVYIATPMESHFRDVMLCLENGKNVLCEKAVTQNAKELKEILEKAKEKNLFFMEAMWMKCMPTFLNALEIVKSGKIGEVQMVKADFCNVVPYDENNRLFRMDCGGGALLDLGVYTITFATAFLGYEPLEIISNARFGQSGADFDETIILRYDNGAFASLTNGMSTHSKNNAIVVGTNGSIYFGEWFFASQEIIIYDKDNKEIERINIKHECNGYEYEVYEAEKCLSENRLDSLLVPHKDTMAVMEIMDSCRKQWNFKYPKE